jgi:hypothetical protein
MKNKIQKLRDLMEKYDLFQQDDEVGVALKDLENGFEYNIANGKDLIKHLDSQNWDLAVYCIKNYNGDITGFNINDNIEELFQHTRGSLDFREVSKKEIEEINKRLN